jgi:hypothetical protein
VGAALLVPGTFLRGTQRSGTDGTCLFRTIYPGWYPGRAVHIHAKGRHRGCAVDDTALLPRRDHRRGASAAPYSARERRDIRNDQDMIFPQSRGSTLMAVTAAEAGHRAEATLVVATS